MYVNKDTIEMGQLTPYPKKFEQIVSYVTVKFYCLIKRSRRYISLQTIYTAMYVLFSCKKKQKKKTTQIMVNMCMHLTNKF